MNLLFWNLNNNSNYIHIRKCLFEKNIDIAVFAEFNNTDFCKLQRNSCYRIIEGFGGCQKIIALSRDPVIMRVRQEQSRYIIYEVVFYDEKYVFVGAHLQDRRSADESVRLETIGLLKNDTNRTAMRIKTNNIIIIGDLNSNPFDRELLQMNAFDAVLFRRVINRAETHIVNGIVRRRLYNPILHFISEDTENYGSFYYDSGSYSPIWNCLDQVLLSNSLSFRINELEYLKTIGTTPLISNVKPKAKISDHLPLFVKII